MRNVKMVSHPENATVHKHLDARSHKGCIVAGSNPVLTTRFGSSPNSMSNTMRNGVIPHMGLLIEKGYIRFD